MPKPTKTKTSLAHVIRERARSPDFLPKSFIADNTRLADETLPRTPETAASETHAPTRPLSQPAPSAVTEQGAREGATDSSSQAPTRTRSYAQAVISAQASEIEALAATAQSGPAPAPQPSPSISPYRRDLKRVATYLTDPAKDQLRVLCFNERTSEEDLLREALDMLFKHRGLAQIAFHGAPSRKPRHH